MRHLAILVLALVACGSTEQPAATDARPNDGPHANADGGVSVDDVTCQTHIRTVVAADGTKTVTETQFALVDGDPKSVVVESCDYTVSSTNQNGMTTTMTYYIPRDPPCPAGAACSTSGAPHPTATHGCVWQPASIALDAKLYVSCGSATKNYNNAGVMTSSTIVTYSAIRLHR